MVFHALTFFRPQFSAPCEFECIEKPCSIAIIAYKLKTFATIRIISCTVLFRLSRQVICKLMAKTGPVEQVSILNTVRFQYHLSVYSLLAAGLFTCCVLLAVLLSCLVDFYCYHLVGKEGAGWFLACV